MNSQWKLTIALVGCVAFYTPNATAELYSFHGRNFCLTEDARVMMREGEPIASTVANSPKSFRLTYGLIKDRYAFAMEVDGSDLDVLNGQYESNEQRPFQLVRSSGVSIALLNMDNGKVEFVAQGTVGTEEAPVWLVVSAQCYKADE